MLLTQGFLFFSLNLIQSLFIQDDYKLTNIISNFVVKSLINYLVVITKMSEEDGNWYFH